MVLETPKVSMVHEKPKGLITPRKFFAEMERSGLKQRFFTILAEGEFRPGQIETVMTGPGETFPKSAPWKESITAAWEKWKIEEVKRNPGFKQWPNDENPSRCHLAHFEVTDKGTLQVVLDPCISYAEYIGSQSEDFIRSYPKKKERPYPLAVSTALIAYNEKGEECVMLTKRNTTHDYKPLGYHVTGGFMEIRKDRSPADTAKRETAEESGVKPEDVSDEDLVCRGIIHNNWSGHADMVFEARTDKKVEQIMNEKGDGENTRLFIPLTASKLREWIIAPTHANVVITSAALALLGKSRFGEKWYEDVMTMLAYRSKDYDQKTARKELEERDIRRLRVKWTHAKGEKEEKGVL